MYFLQGMTRLEFENALALRNMLTPPTELTLILSHSRNIDGVYEL